jgi:hypothetical protein
MTDWQFQLQDSIEAVLQFQQWLNIYIFLKYKYQKYLNKIR